VLCCASRSHARVLSAARLRHAVCGVRFKSDASFCYAMWFVCDQILSVLTYRRRTLHVTAAYLSMFHLLGKYPCRLGRNGIEEIMQHEWFTGTYSRFDVRTMVTFLV
jgi:hypothetical protein